MIAHLATFDLTVLKSYKADILLNKDLTNKSYSNMYEILFDCKNFNSTLDSVLENLQKHTDEKFDVYVKNMWGYVQTPKKSDSMNFNIDFKNQVSIPSKYSFIYLIESPETKVHLSVDEELNQQVTLNEGDLLIFKTEDFINEESTSQNRVALVGSIALVRDNIKPIKKALI
jgi:hypothetical protein